MLVRRYRSDDLEALEKIFSAQGLPFDRNLFLWKKRAPFHLSWVLEILGEVVGHYSVINLSLPFQKLDRAIGFAMDGILSPTVKGLQGIQMLLSTAYQEAKEAGFKHLLGFPNERMAKIKTFLGWQRVGFIEWEWIEKSFHVGSGSGSVDEPKRFPWCYGNDYLDWRWVKAPRNYSFTRSEEGQEAILTVGAHPLLLWSDSETSKPILDRGYYSFSIVQELSPLQRKEIYPSLPLIHFGLVDEPFDLPHVAYWYAEALEGVTLGW